VTPKEVSLKSGGQQQFTAKGFDAFLNELFIITDWTTTGGEIDSTGLYFASLAGDFHVIATARGTAITDSAKVHVEAGALSRIAVSPTEVSLNFGEQQQFATAGFDIFNNEVSFSPTWSTTGGTINETGLYTGTEAGTFIVTATDTSTSVAGAATVTVIPTSVGKPDQKPTEFALFQNYPNPFNPETTIEFSVNEKCLVWLNVFDITGRQIVTLANTEFDAGFYKVAFNAKKLTTGIYLYRIQMKDYIEAKKMLVLE
jgi:hypothetical protein